MQNNLKKLYNISYITMPNDKNLSKAALKKAKAKENKAKANPALAEKNKEKSDNKRARRKESGSTKEMK